MSTVVRAGPPFTTLDREGKQGAFDVGGSILYFVRRDSDRCIKIGITTDLRRRLPDLRRQHGALTLLGTVEGAATREKLAHLIFEDTRLDGEFFEPTAALLSFIERYAAVPPVMSEKPPVGKTRASHERPWIELYGDPLTTHDRDQFVCDYERWIDGGLVSPGKRKILPIFRAFPEKMVFVPQPGLSGWGWTPLNPRCWTDADGHRLFQG